MLRTSAAMVLQRSGSHIRRVTSISACHAYHFTPKNPLLYRLLLDGLCAAAGGPSHSVSSRHQQICTIATIEQSDWKLDYLAVYGTGTYGTT